MQFRQGTVGAAMILQQTGNEVILTNQIDHAEVSGVLARHWGNERFAKPKYCQSVTLACAKHDEAWRTLDERPILDAETLLPHSFLSMPLEEILPAYVDGADRVGREDPYAGFLVSMHYQGFFNSRFGMDPGLAIRPAKKDETAKLATYYSTMEQLRGRFRSIAGERQMLFGHVHSPEVAHAYLLLQVVDVISLFLCIDPKGQWPLGEAERTIGGDRVKLTMKPTGERAVSVSPWPFDVGDVEVIFSVRRVPNRKYESTDDVRRTIAGAQREPLCYCVHRELN